LMSGARNPHRQDLQKKGETAFPGSADAEDIRDWTPVPRGLHRGPVSTPLPPPDMCARVAVGDGPVEVAELLEARREPPPARRRHAHPRPEAGPLGPCRGGGMPGCRDGEPSPDSRSGERTEWRSAFDRPPNVHMVCFFKKGEHEDHHRRGPQFRLPPSGPAPGRRACGLGEGGGGSDAGEVRVRVVGVPQNVLRRGWPEG